MCKCASVTGLRNDNSSDKEEKKKSISLFSLPGKLTGGMMLGAVLKPAMALPRFLPDRLQKTEPSFILSLALFI